MAAWALLGLRVVLALCLFGYVSYALLSVWSARKWSRDRVKPSQDWTPFVTIMKPVRGVDPEAWENFCSFCRLDYPLDRLQILIGALDADDPALKLVQRLQAEFPDHNIEGSVAAPETPPGANRKVRNLTAMLPHAQNDLIVLCDSDMRVRPDYLRRITAPFAPLTRDEGRGTQRVPWEEITLSPSHPLTHSPPLSAPPVGIVTCAYRGERAESFAAVLEAIGIAADFIPSVLVSRAIEGISFALGSTIALPRQVLDRIGGFEPLLDELADDYRLGNGVVKAGYRVVLSDYVIDDILGRERFTAMWSRRLRWSRTLRACRPAGYAGSFITHGFALSLLFLVAMGLSTVGWIVLGAVTALRAGTALAVSLLYTHDRAVLRNLLLLPVSDLLAAALFVVSFFGSHIQWRGERFRLLPGGRLLRED